MSIVVRGLGGTHLVVRGLAEVFGVITPTTPDDPFAVTEALFVSLFTELEVDTRATSATFGKPSSLTTTRRTALDINKADTAIQSRPLTAVVHRTGTSVLVHRGG